MRVDLDQVRSRDLLEQQTTGIVQEVVALGGTRAGMCMASRSPQPCMAATRDYAAMRWPGWYFEQLLV